MMISAGLPMLKIRISGQPRRYLLFALRLPSPDFDVGLFAFLSSLISRFDDVSVSLFQTSCPRAIITASAHEILASSMNAIAASTPPDMSPLLPFKAARWSAFRRFPAFRRVFAFCSPLLAATGIASSPIISCISVRRVATFE